MSPRPNFPKRVFQVAGTYGVIVLAPQYLIETGLLPAPAAPLARPELFYGFVGLALVWQFAFFLIATDVRRYRPLMLISVFEKLAFGVPAAALFAQGRVGADVLAVGSIDLVLGALFVLSYRLTPPAP